MTEDVDLVKRRKMASVISMSFGIPNLVVAAGVALMGLAATILLGVIVFKLLTTDSSDEPLAGLCIVMLLIIFIALLIVAVLLTFVAVVFAVFMGGQSIGGYYAYKGINYKRSVGLIFGGSVMAFIMAIGMILFAVGTGMKDLPQWIALFFGIFELISFAGSLISGIMLIKTKSTFRTVEKKNRKKKKGKK